MYSTDHGMPVLDPAEIRNRRIGLGLSMRELAQRADLSLNTIYRVEKGGEAAHGRTARSLASALGCTPADLITKEVNDGNEH
jgi:transcriptional regulator with XRE-family HTH domain